MRRREWNPSCSVSLTYRRQKIRIWKARTRKAQLQNRIRQASGLDLRLLSYDYELEVQNIEEQADGCVQIEAVEYADMRFSHTPDTNSQVTGVWHSFVIKETDGQ